MRSYFSTTESGKGSRKYLVREHRTKITWVSRNPFVQFVRLYNLGFVQCRCDPGNWNFSPPTRRISPSQAYLVPMVTCRSISLVARKCRDIDGPWLMVRVDTVVEIKLAGLVIVRRSWKHPEVAHYKTATMTCVGVGRERRYVIGAISTH